MTALAALIDEPRRSVIGQRLRKMAVSLRRKLDISERHKKALCLEEHEPQLETACKLAKADHVIRAKIIVDCLPDDLALKVAHLQWDSWSDQVEFHKIIIQSIAGSLE